MKNITISLLFLSLVGIARAANPTFSSFDPLNFIADQANNHIYANTNPAQPNALVTQFQLQQQVVGTNTGLTLAQVIAVGNTNWVNKTNGFGTNENFFGGAYLNLWLPSGVYLRSNTIAPFDWELHNTNGNTTYGAASSPQLTISGITGNASSGSGTFNSLVSTFGSAHSQSGLFTVNSAGNVVGTSFAGNGFNLSSLGNAPNTGQTNVLIEQSNGATDVYDLFNLLQNAGSSAFPPNAEGVLTNNGTGTRGWNRAPAMNGGNVTNLNVNNITNAPYATNYLAKSNVVGWVTGSVPVYTGQTNSDGAFLFTPQPYGFSSPTNTTGGTAVDFALSESTTNIAGTVSLTSVANLTSGVYNRKIIHCINATGSDQSLTIATGWGAGVTDTFTITNGTRKDVLIICQPGVFTNAFQKDIVTH